MSNPTLAKVFRSMDLLMNIFLIGVIAGGIGIGIGVSLMGILSLLVGALPLTAICAIIVFICAISVVEAINTWEKRNGKST